MENFLKEVVVKYYGNIFDVINVATLLLNPTKEVIKRF